MKRILINATHNEEIRVALCKGKHMYDFDLENRTREQKKANIYKAHVTRVEPSLEAIFVEYGAKRQGFLPIREVAKEYLAGNPRNENIRNLIKEGDTLIVQVEKEERGNKGAALSTYVSLAGRYLVLMPNNPRGGGISRQISGKMREEMKRIVANLKMPNGMSVIIRTAGIGKTQEDLQHDLDHLLSIWHSVKEQDRNYPSPRLVHQEAGVVTRALRDYLTEDISEIWIDSEDAYNEAVYFIQSVMPKQANKLRKYTDYEPMFARFGIEKQIETAYQREVRLPSGGSIVIDQTEAMVAIDINSAKSTKGSDVAETAYHTNLEAAEEIARQLRLRDMGGLVVIDFIDMADNQHQKEVEKRLVESTKYDRARIQFTEISKFGLMEMSRQRLRPSLEESTGYKCPRCHGNGMIRDLRSLSLSIMRQIEQIALTHRSGELQAEVPNDIAAFLLNEKRDSLVYLEQDSGTRITILPHSHMESPDYQLHYNPEGFAPSSYERINDSEEEQTNERGYDVNWQTADNKRPKQQPTRKLRTDTLDNVETTAPQKTTHKQEKIQTKQAQASTAQPQAVAWLSNLFAPTPQAQTAEAISSQEVAQAIEHIVNNGGQSLGSFGQVDMSVLPTAQNNKNENNSTKNQETSEKQPKNKRLPNRKPKHDKPRYKKNRKHNQKYNKSEKSQQNQHDKKDNVNEKAKRDANSRRDSRGEFPRNDTLVNTTANVETAKTPVAEKVVDMPTTQALVSQTEKALVPVEQKPVANKPTESKSVKKAIDEVKLQVARSQKVTKPQQVVHLSLDRSKPVNLPPAIKEQLAHHEKPQPPVAPVAEEKAVINKTVETVASEQAEPPVSEKTDVVLEQKEVAIESPVIAETAETTEIKPVIQARADGRAINDPRVVREEMAKRLAEKMGVKKATPQAKPMTISGNVGEFLQNVLENSEERLQKEGVIACFIEAVDKVKQHNAQLVAEEKQAKIEQEKAKQDLQKQALAFDFSNYGYQPLTSDYLSSFRRMINSVNHFATAQGKTDVAPSVIGKRASNDPRGQHADFLATQTENLAETTETAVLEPVEVVENETTNDKKPNVNDEFAETFTRLLDTELSAEVKTETSDDDKISKENDENIAETPVIEETVSVEDDVLAEETAETLDNAPIEETPQAEAESVEEVKTLEQSESEEQPLENEETDDNDERTDEQKERSKTTFDKYKSMLADVSEQLSTTQATGINSLFLATPIVPKARSRKK